MLEELVVGLDRMNEKHAAVTLLDALSRHSKIFEQYDEVARCYFKIKEYDKAFKFAEKALVKSSGNSYAAKYNVINAANHANHPERALTLIKQLELINPNDTDVQMEKAFALFLMNQKDKAEAILRKQLNNPKNNEETKTKIRFNLGTYEMSRDEFHSGLKKFLFEGRKMSFWQKPKLPYPEWDGNPEPGKTIVLRSEAGMGDEFVNVRFMHHLKELGMNPIWFSDRKDVAKLFNRNGFKTVTDVFELKKEKNIAWIHSMDTPIYLNLEYKDLWKGPYFKADQELVEKYKSIISSPKLKIGLRWQGFPGYDQDLHRSIPLKEIYDSVKHLNADFYSLQRDNGMEEIGNMPIVDLSDKLTDFDQTLAIIENLDLVITSCTSIVHAAAAMGKPVVVLVPISSYYVWCHTAEKSPWYGENVTILRQQKPRVWDEPLAKLKEFVNENYNH